MLRYLESWRPEGTVGFLILPRARRNQEDEITDRGTVGEI